MDRKKEKKYRKNVINSYKDEIRCLYFKGGHTNQRCKNYKMYNDESGINYFCYVHKNKIQPKMIPPIPIPLPIPI